MDKKVCRKCKKEKDINLFNKLKIRKDGHRSHCRECDRAASKEYGIKNRDIRRQKGREYAKRNIEKRKQYTIDHPEQVKATKNRYLINHPEKRRESANGYYARNKNKVKERNKLRKEKINLARRIYNQTHPQTRIAHNLRTSIWRALTGRSKGGRLYALLGCDLDFFKQHLESLFSKDMVWGNYGAGVGKWSIDHIIPLETFNLEDYEQQKIAFHWSNCQPLWVSENARKGCKYNGIDYRNKKNV